MREDLLRIRFQNEMLYRNVRRHQSSIANLMLSTIRNVRSYDQGDEESGIFVVANAYDEVNLHIIIT